MAEILKDRKLIAALTEAIGPSAHEEAPGQIAVAAMKKLAKDVVSDRLGSTVAVLKTKARNPKRVLVAAHIDEVGFLAQGITKNGGVKLLPVGGLDITTLFGNRVKLLTRSGKVIHGAIHYKAALPADRKTPKTYANIVADFGFADDKDAKKVVTVGDPIVFDVPFIPAQNGRFLAKALDDRLGVVAVLAVLQRLAGKDLGYELHIGFTVQEEVGLRGGRTLAAFVKPDFAIAVDVSNVFDLGGDADSGLGRGFQFRPKDAASIQSPKVSHWFLDLVNKHKIPFQSLVSLGGTDAGAFHLSYAGVPTLQIGIPAREIHTSASMFDEKDLKSAVDALELTLTSLKPATIDGFKQFIK